jgi:hypothetical protein
MRKPSLNVIASLALLAACAAGPGCSSNDVAEVLGLPLADVDGNWSYAITNGDQATFVGCSGDAAVLEGQTFDDAQSMAPICHLDGSVTVAQDLAAMIVMPDNVTCSDGSSAVVSGVGIVTEDSVSGEWNSASDQNVIAMQSFDGAVNGSTITLTEDSRDFSGDFDGSCDIFPPLSATVTIQ